MRIICQALFSIICMSASWLVVTNTPSYIVDNSKLEGGGKEESGEKGKSKKEEEGDPALDTLV